MTVTQHIITISMVISGTVITRALPFLIFKEGQETPKFIQYLGKYLPGAVFAMLVVYCLKGVSFISAPFGIPEIIGIAVTVLLHLWERQMLISIAGGTAVYMLLVQLVF